MRLRCFLRAFSALAFSLVACGGDRPDVAADGGQEPMLLLVPTPREATVRPGGSAHITFRLSAAGGRPMAERVIRFSIIDDPNTSDDDARGATLSFDRGLTNGTGDVTLQVLVGQPTVFRVRASTERAVDAEAVIFVASGTHGTAEVVPVIAGGAGVEITTVRLHFYDATACRAVSIDSPPGAVRPVRSLPAETSAVYASIDTEASHAIVALGLSADGAARTGGCVDLPGRALLLDQTVRIVLPLAPLAPLAEGRHEATTQISIAAPGHPGIAAIGAAWKELSECPTDPARLWVDCTVDALGGTTAADPLDCRPGVETGLGGRIAARRGVISPVGTRCHARQGAAGQMTVDALAESLFPRPRPALLADLPSLGREASSLLTGMRLHTTLVFSRTVVPGRLRLDHALRAAELPMAAVPTRVNLVEVVGPISEARFVPVSLRGRELEIATHGFTLRLGSVARYAFGRVSLRPRAVPSEVAAFVNALFALASHRDGASTLTGCGALDAVICADAGEPRGCLVTACLDGLTALARRLDAGFQALDGDELDFLLGGSATFVDRDADRVPDGIAGGLWTGELRTRGATSSFSGTWSAERAR